MYQFEEDKKVSIATAVTIDATPEKVWSVLSDIENWPKWTQFIASFKGDFKANGQIQVTFNTPDGPVTFDRTLVIFEENRVFCWEGDAMFPGSKDHHLFLLQKTSDGKTQVTQADGFHGIEKTKDIIEAEGQTVQLYEFMNQDLKAYIEKTVL